MPLQFFPFVYIIQYVHCTYYVCGVAIGYICMSYVRLELECGDGRGKRGNIVASFVKWKSLGENLPQEREI